MKVAPMASIFRPNLDSRFATMLFCAAVSISALAPRAVGQQGYGSYYGQQVRQTTGGLPPSPNKFLYDKYFYNRPTVSPYINLDMGDTDSGTAYQSYVRPQQQMRQQQRYNQAMYIDARKKEGRVGDTRLPGAMGGGNVILKPAQKRPQSTTGAYQNHWYGSWNK